MTKPSALSAVRYMSPRPGPVPDNKRGQRAGLLPNACEQQRSTLATPKSSENIQDQVRASKRRVHEKAFCQMPVALTSVNDYNRARHNHYRKPYVT